MNAELEKPLLLRPENEEACIMADKVSQIYAGTNNAIIATIINSSILAKIMWPVIGHQTLLIWLSYAFGISLLRGITAFRYQKKPPLPEHAYRWMWLYILGSSLAALSWSAATIWLFPADDVARQVFLAFVIGGMAAGAVTNMSHLKLAIYPYLCFTLTPLIGRFFYDHSELGGDMGIMTSLYLLMLLFAVRRAHSNIDQNIQLRIEAAARESALAKSQQRYKTLLEKTTDAFILHDLNGKFLEVNQQACRSLGYSRDELLGMSVKDIEVKRGEDELRCLWDKLSENKTIMLEGMHRRKDGEKFPVEISVGLVFVNGENLVSVSIRDITERKKIELERINFIKILDDSWNEIYMFDAVTLLFTQISKGGMQNLGYSKKELCSMTPYDIKPGIDESMFKEILRPLIQGETKLLTFKTSHQRKDGSVYPVEIRLQLMEHEVNPTYVAIVQDITERISAEQRIRELARFPEEAISPIIKVSGDGIISYANPASKMMRQYLHVDTGDKLPEDIRIWVERAIEIQTAQEYILNCGERTFSMLLAPVADLNAVYIYGLDVTQQMRDQAELRTHKDHLEEMVAMRTDELSKATALANDASIAKSQFLSNMSHEIRTPLSSILGFAEILDEGEKTGSEQTTAISAILSSSHHLQEIINDILDLSKIEARKMEVEIVPVNIADILREIELLVRSQIEAKGLKFSVDNMNDIPVTIYSDPVRLKQILLNLCSNALKFTQQGKIRIVVSAIHDTSELRVEVSDTGIGITSEQMGKLFQAFSQADSSITRKYGGTGLGLILCRQLAELLGARLLVASEYGEGSSFILVLPLSAATQNQHDVNHQTGTESKFLPLKGRVLLVEDTQPMQELIGSLLKRMGLEYELAENGQIAIDKASSQDFDLIIMDIQMPVMGGVEATKILRGRNYKKPIVALTANALDTDRDACLEAGCNEFVTKPVGRQQLYDVVSRYLQGTKNKS